MSMLQNVAAVRSALRLLRNFPAPPPASTHAIIRSSFCDGGAPSPILQHPSSSLGLRLLATQCQYAFPAALSVNTEVSPCGLFSHKPLHLQLAWAAREAQHQRFSSSAEAVALYPPRGQDREMISQINSPAETLAKQQHADRGHLEVTERLNQLEKIVEQHSQSLASLSSQLEAHKQLFSSILEDIKLLKSYPGSRVLKVSPSSHDEAILDSSKCEENVSANNQLSQPLPCWPEWTSFLQHLRGLPFFKEVLQGPGVEGAATFDEPTTLKRTLSKFSLAYDTIFDSLSLKHLQVLAQYGCPNDDRRTVASGKRLRNHFQMEEKSNTCGSAFIKPANVNPKLSDVMRLIYTTVEVSSSRKGEMPDNVKLSVLHLLEEITSLTSKHSRPETSLETSTWDKESKLQKFSDRTQNVEAKKKEKDSKSSHDIEVLSQSDKWKCPRCSCMNLPSKSKCVECSFPRSEECASDIESAMQQSSDVSAPSMDVELHVSSQVRQDREKVSLACNKDVELPILSNKSRDGAKKEISKEGLVDVSTKLASTGRNRREAQMATFMKEDASKLGSDGLEDVSDVDEHSNIFDVILDADDPSSRSQTQQGIDKKCSLSDLVRQNMKAFVPSRREREQGGATGTDDYGRKEVRPFRGKGYGDEDFDSRSRRRFHRGERDDSDMEIECEDTPLHRSGRGRSSFGSSTVGKRSESHDHRPGLGGRNSSGSIYGNNRPRYNERRTEGRPHRSRGYSEDEFEESGSRPERRGGFGRERGREGRSRY